MKYERTASFKNDYRSLSPEHKQLFRDAVVAFNAACDDYVANGGQPQWPARLRVKSVEGAKGVWEMTWSFSGPDGRATWEWTTVDDEPAILWRRIGDHRIFSAP